MSGNHESRDQLQTGVRKEWLEAEIHALKYALDAADKTIERYTEENNDLKYALDAADKTIERYTEENNDLTAAYAELETTYDDFHNAFDNVRQNHAMNHRAAYRWCPDRVCQLAQGKVQP